MRHSLTQHALRDLTLPKRPNLVPLHQIPSANSDTSNAAILDLPTAMHDLADLLDLGRPCEEPIMTSLTNGLGLR
jgi:hypothetical protein